MSVKRYYARTGRLAPTPSGRLHLGNVCAFAGAWLSARSGGARLRLRIEDVDGPRARAATVAGLREDLAWLGLDWDDEVAAQSTRDYSPWLDRLAGSTYYCRCTRALVQAAGGIYPGTCRDRGHTEGAVRLRLPDRTIRFVDRARGPQEVALETLSDPLLRRRDGVFAYPLAVVADDIADGVTEVVRGADLLEQSAVQMVLWDAFGARPPSWLHAPLILGADGRKLSKSHQSSHIGDLRAAGWRPRDVWRVVLPWLGLDGHDTAADAVRHFDPSRVPAGPFTWTPPAHAPASLNEVPCP
jgi:glutamyl/glutaminyl-tRNA synthetase